MNSTGTVGCAQTDEGPLILYDIKNRKHLYNIEHGTVDKKESAHRVKPVNSDHISVNGGCPY